MALRQQQDQPKLPSLYLAGPLFSYSEKQFNVQLRSLLNPYFRVYLPQEDGGLFTDFVRAGVAPQVAANKIFRGDINAITACDVLFLVLDGRSVDEGAAFELGVAYALGKTCFGLQTDVRRLLPIGNNPMIAAPLSRVFQSLGEMSNWAREFSRKFVFPAQTVRPNVSAST
jgi:nucleoside 2-deoxyribosyltransferase